MKYPVVRFFGVFRTCR